MARGKAKLKEMNFAFYGPEPSFAYDHNLDKSEYISALNWYAATLSREESKDYVTSFLREQKNKSFLKKVKKVPHMYFTPTYGAIARMLANDFLIPDSGPKWLDKNLNELIALHSEDEPKEVKKAPVDIQARMNTRARAIAGEIDDIFEDNVWFCKNKLDPNFIFNFLHKKNVSGPVAFKVAELFTPHLDELKSIKKDEQLQEAYSAYSKKDIKRFIDFYHDVVETCLNYNVNSKKSKVRKPRAKKAVSADKKVGSLKYLKLYQPFQLASVNPSKVLKASQIWLFDTKYTKLTMLNALDRAGIDVKGQTFLNVDKKSSVTKKVGRNTKDVINAILSSSKPRCRKELEEITVTTWKAAIAEQREHTDSKSVLMELLFEKTCDACPEQYDVFDGDKQVAYVRLRHGVLVVQCPDVGGDCVYQALIGTSGYDGEFETEAERAYHLEEARIAIESWMKENE